MQFWKGQRIIFNGLLGTVYQDQGLDQTVKINLDKTKNVVRSVYPRQISLIASQAEEDTLHDWHNRRYWP